MESVAPVSPAQQVHLHTTHVETNFFRKYVFSIDHKTIAKQFLISSIVWAVIGMFLSVVFRLQLGFPDAQLAWLKPIFGDFITSAGKIDSEYYLALITMHGTIMVFFVLTAGLSGTFSNLLIPLQLGARDMASGFLNMLSYWAFFVSSLVMLSSFFVSTGPASAGWTVYPPLSALPQAISGSGLGMTLWLVSMAFFIVSVLLGGHQLCIYHYQYAYAGNESVTHAAYHMEFFAFCRRGVTHFPLYCFRAFVDMTSEIIPKAGNITIYTSGCPRNQKRCWYNSGEPPVLGNASPAMYMFDR